MLRRCVFGFAPHSLRRLLADKIRDHKAQAWLVNTGWTGGPYGVGSRIKLGYTRAIVDAIHDGSLLKVPAVQDSHWNLQIPTSCPGVPAQLLQPRDSWRDPQAYDQAADQLAALFRQNYEKNFGGRSDGL